MYIHPSSHWAYIRLHNAYAYIPLHYEHTSLYTMLKFIFPLRFQTRRTWTTVPTRWCRWRPGSLCWTPPERTAAWRWPPGGTSRARWPLTPAAGATRGTSCCRRKRWSRPWVRPVHQPRNKKQNKKATQKTPPAEQSEIIYNSSIQVWVYTREHAGAMIRSRLGYYTI